MRSRRDKTTWWCKFHLDMLPIPRVSAYLSPGEELGDTLSLELDLSNSHSEVVTIGVEFPWRRPRPWEAEFTWPPRPASGRVFTWKRPTAEDPIAKVWAELRDIALRHPEAAGMSVDDLLKSYNQAIESFRAWRDADPS